MNVFSTARNSRKQTMSQPNPLNKFLDSLDPLWLRLHGLVIDQEYEAQASNQRERFDFNGTLKVAPSRFPGADAELNKVLQRHGGWTETFASTRTLPEELFIAMERIGYHRDCIERSRAYIQNSSLRESQL